MWVENHHWHYDYVRLAQDFGFRFVKRKNLMDRKPLCSIDIERVINERDIATIEKLIPTVINYTLDPNQISVLDSTFINIFRLSQLMVEYLLFCKKYLDDTTALLKKELNQLRVQNKELIEQTKNSSANQKFVTPNVFKCGDCNKVFASEDFLISHRKRRHNNNNLLEGVDKLQDEIKELKGRLNTAEKLAKENNNKANVANAVLVDEEKFVELQKELENLKTHMEQELKTLKDQRQFEEKLINSLRPLTPIVYYEKEVSTDLPLIKERTESTTQTEEAPRSAKLQEQKIEEILDHKVTSKLQSIEGKMQDFFNNLKLQSETQNTHEIEEFQKKVLETLKTPREVVYIEKEVTAVDLAVEKKESTTQTQFSNIEVKEKEQPKIEEILDQKVTSKLHDIEQQIQLFFDKLKPSPGSIRSEAGDSRGSAELLSKPKTKLEEKLEETPLVQNFSAEIDNKLIAEMINIRNVDEPKLESSFTDNLTIDSVFKVIEDSVNNLVKESEKFKTSHSRSTSKELSNKLQAPLLESSHFPHKKEDPVENDAKKSDSDSEDLTESFMDLSENEIRLIKEYQQSSPNKLRDISEILYETDEEVSSRESSAVNLHETRRTNFKPSGTTLDKRSFTSLKKVAFEPEVLDHFKKEIEKLLKKRLQDLGVSPKWKGIPIKTFKKVMEIVNHQVLLTKKNYLMYDTTKNEIEKVVHEKALKDLSELQKNNTKLSHPHDESKKINGTTAENQRIIPSQRIQKQTIESKIIPNKLSFRTLNRNIKNNLNEQKRNCTIGGTIIQTKTKENNRRTTKGLPTICVKKKVLFDLNNPDHCVGDTKLRNANNKLPINDGDSTSMSSSVFDDEINNK